MRGGPALPLLLALAASSAAMADSDTDALKLADTTPEETARASNWRFFGEPAVGLVSVRGADGGEVDTRRLSLGVQGETSQWHSLRASFADRWDIQGPPSAFGQRHANINTLKEGYLSWQAGSDWSADLGRINVLHGVALGYNPTDYFRAGAIRSIVSVDPASLKENRLGSAMARGQMLWNGGSVSAMFSPKLAVHDNNASFSPDWGATNFQNRGLIALAQRIGEDVNLGALLFDDGSHPPQLGLNTIALLNDSTVAFLEWSGGSGPTQEMQALGSEQKDRFHQRFSTGASYTTSGNVSLTFEYEYDGAALNRSGLDTLLHQSPQAYGQYFLYTANAQELPGRQAVFFYAGWNDAFVQHLDLSGFARYNLVDHSHLQWAEARYHLNRVDLAIQWQTDCGDSTSEFGAAPQSSVWQILLRYFY
ncbi:MAG: hypothetical protein P4L83_10030 [Nevskia sp.]|nr:hypothetical protein [Nevskia sp.]